MKPVVQQCTDYISEIVNGKLGVIESEKLPALLSYLSELLARENLQLQVRGVPQGSYCLYCDKYISSVLRSDAIGIWCAPTEHYFCSKDCFRKHVLVSTNNTLLELERVQCPYCRLPIPMEQLSEVFDGKIEDFQRDACDRALLELLDEEDKERMRARFTCLICFSELKVEEGLTLECDHRFCTDCITQHVHLLIEDAQVSDNSLKCPSCPQPLSIYEIEGIVSEEEFEKYMKFKLRGIQVSDGSELIFHCLGTDCEYFCILDNNADEFTCPRCNFKCCPQCKEEVHKESTCEQYKQWKLENDTGDNKMNEIFNREGLMKCPVCGTIIQKVDGCQFISCSSSQCQGRTYLCWDCGQKLDQDHGAHKCNPRRVPQGGGGLAPAHRPEARVGPPRRRRGWNPFGRRR